MKTTELKTIVKKLEELNVTEFLVTEAGLTVNDIDEIGQALEGTAFSWELADGATQRILHETEFNGQPKRPGEITFWQSEEDSNPEVVI